MVLLPTYYSFGLDGASAGTGNRLNAISAKVSLDFPQYTISAANRISFRRSRGGRSNLGVQQPSRFVIDVQNPKPPSGPGFDDRPSDGFGFGSGVGGGSVAPNRPSSSGPSVGAGGVGPGSIDGRPTSGGRIKPKPSTIDSIIFERPDRPDVVGPRDPDSRPKPDDDTGVDVTIGPGPGIGGRPIDERPNDDDNGFGLGFGPQNDTSISIDGRPIDDVDGPSIGVGPERPGTISPGRPGVGPDFDSGPGVQPDPGIIDGRPGVQPDFGYGPGIINIPGGRPAPDRPIPPDEKPDLGSGLGVVTIIDDPADDPGRPGGVDSGANSETGENSPEGTIQTQFGFVFPAKYRINFRSQLPKYLRDRDV